MSILAAYVSSDKTYAEIVSDDKLTGADVRIDKINRFSSTDFNAIYAAVGNGNPMKFCQHVENGIKYHHGGKILNITDFCNEICTASAFIMERQLPILRRKAGNDAKKLKQIDDLEKQDSAMYVLTLPNNELYFVRFRQFQFPPIIQQLPSGKIYSISQQGLGNLMPATRDGSLVISEQIFRIIEDARQQYPEQYGNLGSRYYCERGDQTLDSTFKSREEYLGSLYESESELIDVMVAPWQDKQIIESV